MVKKSPRRLVLSRRIVLSAGIVAAVLLCALTTGLIWSAVRSHDTGIDASKYQAVFLTNGEVYFGKLQSFTPDYMKLTDIFYLKSQASDAAGSVNPQRSDSASGDVQLIKLGNEVHGPQDEMVITKSQILYFENLKTTSTVAKTMQKYNDAH